MTAEPEDASFLIDTSKPHPARVYDWLLGGKDNYLVDREVGEKLPPEAEADAARHNRAFMHRAAAWLAHRASTSSWTSAPASRPSPTCTRSSRASRRPPGSCTPTTTRSCCATRRPCWSATPKARPTTSRRMSASPRPSSNTPARYWTSAGRSRCPSSRCCTSSPTRRTRTRILAHPGGRPAVGQLPGAVARHHRRASRARRAVNARTARGRSAADARAGPRSSRSSTAWSSSPPAW